MSFVWLFIGGSDIYRHREIGWLIVALWAIGLIVWIRRLVIARRREPAKTN